MLIDIVSKNGNLLLNVVQTPEGDLEPGVVNTLEELAAWTAVNGEGIYGTRPWKLYGEGPSVHTGKEPGAFGGVKDFGEKKYSSEDFRFTKKGRVVYAFCLAKPAGDMRILSMGKHAGYLDSKIKSVEILGLNEHLTWKQGDDALVITKPAALSDSQTITLKIVLNK